MSYQVLARKWRPGVFAELVGQEHVVAAISNALDNDRLHHAYLFTGTRGVGKTTIARIFAKSLNCETGMSSTPCGQCAACQEIEQGRYVDLLEIDAASRTKVEDTRELLDNVQYKPSRGTYKVYLIDEVHMLSKHSFNALLKTLEEPPPHVKFLLATTDPQKLPITILSRCLQFNLKALSREQIAQQLQHILTQESIASEQAAISHLARAAQGSMRDALSLTDQAIAQGDGKVFEQVVVKMLGLMDRNQVLKLLHAIANRQNADVMALVESMSQLSADFEQVLAELMSLLHQVALTQLVPDVCKLETTFAKSIYQLAKNMPAEQVQLLYQIAIQGRKDISFSADSRIGLEMTLLRMLAFVPESTALPREQILQQADQQAPMHPIASQVQAQDQIQPQEQVPPEVDPSLVEQQNQILQQAQQQHPASFASQPNPLAYEMVEEESFSQPEPEHYQAQTMLPAEPEPEPEPEPALSVTENLIRIKRSLQVAAKGEQGASASEIKKSEPDVPSLLDSRSEVTANDLEDSTSQEPLFDAPPTSACSVQDMSDKQSEIVEEIDTSPPWQVSAQSELSPSVEIAEPQELAQVPILASDTESTQVNTANYSVDVEIPAYLGEVKVTRASQLDTWSQLIEQMNITALIKQLALHSSYRFDQGKVTLTLAADKNHLLNPTAEKQLGAALESALGQNIELNIQIGEPINTPFALQQKVNKMRQQHAEQQVETDPAIQLLMGTFSASKIEDSIKPR